MKNYTETKLVKILSLSLAVATLSPQVEAGLSRAAARDQGIRLYSHITGVSPSDSAIAAMTDLLANGKVSDAAFYAMNDPNLNFYRVNLKQMFNAISTQSQDSSIPLNDATALAIGLIRDNQRFDQILYGDVFYMADPAKTGNAPLISALAADRSLAATPSNTVTPLFASQMIQFPSNTATLRVLYQNESSTTRVNAHFNSLAANFPTDWPSRLMATTQSNVYYAANDLVIPQEDIAGWMTTLQTAGEFYNAGTNRRMFRYVNIGFLCKDMDQLHDTSVTDEMIRADVDRQPGGSVDTYLNTCKGCHAGIDGFVEAFAFMDYANARFSNGFGAFTYINAPGALQGFLGPVPTAPAYGHDARNMNKQFRQVSVYPNGFNPTRMQANGNNWKNKWVTGTNPAVIGWRVPDGMNTYASGKGLKQLGKVLAATTAFSSCMTRRVFQDVCFRSPTLEEAGDLANMQSQYESGFSEYAPQGADGKYNMKALFAKSAGFCFGK